MAHFAKLDENNVVVKVIVVHNNHAPTEEAGAIFVNKLFKTDDVWKQTSYNTRNGVHILGGTPFRMNYAGIGDTYDAARDAFIPHNPYASWTFNESRCDWDPPIPKPDAGTDIATAPTHVWDEALYQSDNTKGWVEEPRE